MDLLLTVLVLCVIGFMVWILTERIPMTPLWKTMIQVFAALA